MLLHLISLLHSGPNFIPLGTFITFVENVESNCVASVAASVGL